MSEPRVATDRNAFRRAAAGEGERVPVEVRVRVDDPFAAYRRAREGRGGFFLETSGGQPGWGYFGVDPIERLEVGPEASALSAGAESAGDERDELSPANGSPTLAALSGLLDGESLARGDCEVPYPCGAFGWLSYDVARELEDLPDTTRDDRELPNLQVGVYETVAAWEEPISGAVTLRVTSCPRVEGDVDAAYDRGREQALELARAAVDGDPSVGAPPVDERHAEFESQCGREDYADRIQKVKRYIREGDTFQANISHRLVAPAAVHPVSAYAALRRVNPAPYSGLLEFPGVDLVSASPELLLDVEGDRIVTEPIAGTRPRGETTSADADLERELLTDEKERAEHAMLVDLERNDLGKVCSVGSVEVSDYRRVDRYSEVMHLVSVVEGRLREDVGIADAVAAVFPGGTITGAPKPRTMEIIDEVEATRRGPYTGAMAAFGFDDRATLNIVIRTLVRTGDTYGLRVGGGIVHDSEPDFEYEETLSKARALISAVDEALGERATFAVEP